MLFKVKGQLFNLSITRRVSGLPVWAPVINLSQTVDKYGDLEMCRNKPAQKLFHRFYLFLRGELTTELTFHNQPDRPQPQVSQWQCLNWCFEEKRKKDSQIGIMVLLRKNTIIPTACDRSYAILQEKSVSFRVVSKKDDNPHSARSKLRDFARKICFI